MGKDESKKIFANGKKTSQKSSESKSFFSLPDIAKTPSTPGNIPVPYPNTAKSTEISKGYKKVKSSGKQIRTKKSSLKTSKGDEA